MLEAHGLTKRYNSVTALDASTLTVAPGDVFCLLLVWVAAGAVLVAARQSAL